MRIRYKGFVIEGDINDIMNFYLAVQMEKELLKNAKEKLEEEENRTKLIKKLFKEGE